MLISEKETVKFLGYVPAGFPSPASDYMEEDIDLKQYLQPHPTATFLARAVGDSMTNAPIPNNALLVVDKSLKPKNNSIVIASVNGEYTVKHFVKIRTGVFLCPNNPLYKPLKITEDMDFSIWGVVTYAIISFK
jgi:DNA polymerase V